ncbi:MAG: hypothetical protein HRT50_14065 [Colwellia sp.]|uniref:LPS translocon maturation chaperone LptM n=1 Tax=Colwellia sp. TaxID=56799 RepID=UPI001D95C60C|nr:lipoprotein [Colwellia sp.]NQY50199.1 hypothetical protein [Colwellia sp.]
MRTNRLRYLQQKLHRTLHIKSILLAILGAILLSACGIKGDLYQTPEQVITEQNTEQDKITKQRDESQEKPVTTLDGAEKNSAVQQPIAQATIPAVKQSTEQIKE